MRGINLLRFSAALLLIGLPALRAASVATPTFSPAGGVGRCVPFTVTLSTTTSGASIRYTTDGSTPSSTAGTLYSGPITVSNTTTIKAIAFKSGLTNSTVSSATYTSSQQLPPTISPSGGIYTAPVSVTLGAYKQNTTLYYSTDGSLPTNTAGTFYSGPVTVSATTTINAVAYTPCIAPSSVTTGTYIIQALAPAFSPSGGTYTGPQTVVLSTSTSGASIRYTTDGSVPSDTIGALYTGPITVGVTTTINAVAYKSGLLNSAVSSATYTIRPILVTLAPSAVSLYQSGTQHFTATVTNTSNTAVTWTVSGAGTVNASGLYTAPSTIASQQTATVTATSQADNTKSASATVTLMPPVAVSVSPITSTHYGNQTQQFTATVTNTSNTAVTWTVSGAGTVNASGLYTAPSTIASQQTATVTATSQADNTKSSSATVTLMPVAVGVSPATTTLYASQTQQFAATVTNTTNTTVTWSVSGAGTVNASGLYTAPATITSQQTDTVTATSQADNTKSASATITLMPPVAVSVSPTTTTLYGSQTQQFTTTVTNTGNTAVTWTVSGAGTVNAAGLYTAPSTIASQQTDTVTATSQADNTKSASAAVTLMPALTVSVSPTTVTLSRSQTQQFTAAVTNTSNTAVTWSINPAGTGTVDSTGLYTAPATVAAQQVVTVTATSQADARQSASAAVTLSPCTLSGYTYQRAIVIDHTKVPNTDQFDFPLLVNITDPSLASTANGGHVTSPSGYDIVFASDAGGANQLDHQIDSYNPVTGQFVAWVRIPVLSHTSDTTIYVLYGNALIGASLENPMGVWESDYEAVWHFGNGTMLSGWDATGSGWDGTIHGATATSGQISGAAGFSGTGQYIDIGNMGARPAQGTISMWVKAPALASSPNAFTTGALDGSACGNAAIRLELTATGNFDVITGADNATCGQNVLDLTGPASFTANALHYVTLTWDSSRNTETLYFDGGSPQTSANSNWPTNFTDVQIGTGFDMSRAWNGQIDEVRISSVVRSADWVAAEYNNQSSPATFSTLGAESTQGVGITPANAVVYPWQAQQFTVVFLGGCADVAWSVSPAGVGTIDSTGLYTAPAGTSTLQTATVTATTQGPTPMAATSAVLVIPQGPVSVAVSPATSALLAGQSRQFTAYVTNTPNTAVTWSIAPEGVGTISSAGLYTAPATIGAQQTVTVTATSQADTTQWASVLVTITPLATPPPVVVSPASATIYVGRTRQFTATVTNNSNVAVTWSIAPAGTGTISSTGLYTAPTTAVARATVVVTATSQADTTQWASALVTIEPLPVTVSVSPGTATVLPGQTEQFTATVTNTANTAVTWSINPSGAGSIDSTGLYTAPTTITAAETVTVTATSHADPGQWASASVTVSAGTITSVTPSQAAVGTTQTVTISGINTGFAQGQTQVSFCANVSASNIAVASPTQLTATVLPAFTAAPGACSVTVTTGGASATLADALRITGPPISITSPANLSFVSTPTITVSGQVGDPNAVVTVNNLETPNGGGSFSVGVPLSEGNNTVTVFARSVGWATSIAIIQVNLDTTPPHLAIVSPPPGTQTADASITVAGMVNDIVVGTVNDRQAQVTVNGVAATVANRSFSSIVPLAMGRNSIQVVVQDRVGNTATASVTVQRVPSAALRIVSGDNQSGPVQNPLPLPLVVQVLNATGVPVPNRPVVFTVAQNDGGVSATAASGVGTPSASVTTDSNGQAQVYWTLGSHAGSGNNRVAVSSPGTQGWAYFSASGVPSAPARIVVDSGLNQTGAAGEVLPLPFIAVVIDAGNNRLANVPVTFTVIAGGGTLSGSAAQLNSAAGSILANARDGRPLRVAPRATPAATASSVKPRRAALRAHDDSSSAPPDSVTMISDGDGRVAAFLQLGPNEGRSNNIVQAAFEGDQGAPATFMASGLVAGNPAQTSVTGVVLTNSSVPIPGVTMRLLGLQQGTNGNVPVEVVPPVQTDAQGQFTITQAPVGVFKLMADGTTATVPGKQYPTLEFDVTTVAGRSTTVGMPMYLQALDTVNQLCVSDTSGGTLTLPAFPGFSLTVAAGSATFPGGSRSGCISATPVNPDKVPMAPGFGQQPRFILTIQPVGTTFNPPAAMTIPNFEALPPRAVTELYSYDHDLAAFVAIGTGTVSVDGSVIASDPGVGVLKAGWHCGGPPAPPGDTGGGPGGGPPGPDGTCSDCQMCTGVSGCFPCAPDPGQNGQSCKSKPGGCCKGGSCQGPGGGNPAGVNAVSYKETITGPTSNDYGLTTPHDLSIDIAAVYDQASNSWKARLTKADLPYDIFYRILPGQHEPNLATLTTQAQACKMRLDLSSLGEDANCQTYMVSAVEAHERVHVTTLKQCVDPQFADLKASIEALSVPFSCQVTAEQAKGQLQALPGYQAAQNAARNAWIAVWNVQSADDHTPGGRCDQAERAVVNQVVANIDQLDAQKGWVCH